MHFSSRLTRAVGATAVAAAFLLPAASHAQGVNPNWFNLDLQTDSVFGISSDRAYKEILSKKKPAARVIVAVIDNGVDVGHVDLQGQLWQNTKEKAGNGKDDDKNGYVDDVAGWSFLGGKTGDVQYETLELTRLLRMMRPRYENVSDTTALNAAQRDSVRMFREMQSDYDQQMQQARMALDNITAFGEILDSLVAHVDTTKNANPTLAQFQAYRPRNGREVQVQRMVVEALKENPDFKAFREDRVESGREHFAAVIEYNLNYAYNPRGLVGDDTTNFTERGYGNNNLKGPDGDHGTHVAGIIGASRKDTVGIKGVADAVWLMPVRAVPEGDERDKDVAAAIRYAVDNGAKVINMSFGKAYGQNKKIVDDAVKYAMSKDVLLIHGAGNDGINLDKKTVYPNRTYADGSGVAEAWMEVGASSWAKGQRLVASFSNYGKTTVDIFAPGVQIYSTVPGSKYAYHDGTSMASPVVAGVAALVRSRYPKLTAVQVKEILMKSVTKVDNDVLIMDDTGPKTVPFSDVCISGGIVNAYAALKLAETYK